MAPYAANTQHTPATLEALTENLGELTPTNNPESPRRYFLRWERAAKYAKTGAAVLTIFSADWQERAEWVLHSGLTLKTARAYYEQLKAGNVLN